MKKLITLFLLVVSLQLSSQTIYSDRLELVNLTTNTVLEEKVEVSMFMFTSSYVAYVHDGITSMFSVLSVTKDRQIYTYKTLNSNSKIIYFHRTDKLIGMNDEINELMLLFYILR